MSSWSIRLIGLFFVMLFLASCGKKGPLYHPEASKETTTPTHTLISNKKA